MNRRHGSIDPRRLGLLEHDLAHQDRPGTTIVEPREVAREARSARAAVPDETRQVATTRRRHRRVAVAPGANSRFQTITLRRK